MAREEAEVVERTAAEEAGAADILAGYGVDETTSIAMVEALKRWPDDMRQKSSTPRGFWPSTPPDSPRTIRS